MLPLSHCHQQKEIFYVNSIRINLLWFSRLGFVGTTSAQVSWSTWWLASPTTPSTCLTTSLTNPCQVWPLTQLDLCCFSFLNDHWWLRTPWKLKGKPKAITLVVDLQPFKVNGTGGGLGGDGSVNGGVLHRDGGGYGNIFSILKVMRLFRLGRVARALHRFLESR